MLIPSSSCHINELQQGGPMRTRWLTFFVAATAIAFAASKGHAQNRNDIFRTSKVWSVELTFSPKEYAALMPLERSFLQFLLGAKSQKKDEPAREVHRNTFGADLPWVTGAIKIGDEIFQDVGIRYKGNGTFSDAARTIAKSFKI